MKIMRYYRGGGIIAKSRSCTGSRSLRQTPIRVAGRRVELSIKKRNIFIITEPLQGLHLCGYLSPALILVTYPSILMYLPPPTHGKMTGKEDLWNRNKPSAFDREKKTQRMHCRSRSHFRNSYPIQTHLWQLWQFHWPSVTGWWPDRQRTGLGSLSPQKTFVRLAADSGLCGEVTVQLLVQIQLLCSCSDRCPWFFFFFFFFSC